MRSSLTAPLLTPIAAAGLAALAAVATGSATTAAAAADLAATQGKAVVTALLGFRGGGPLSLILSPRKKGF